MIENLKKVCEILGRVTMALCQPMPNMDIQCIEHIFTHFESTAMFYNGKQWLEYMEHSICQIGVFALVVYFAHAHISYYILYTTIYVYICMAH